MHFASLAVVLLGVFVAYVNGANDVSKGVATLAGSRVSSYRRAILWGALWTTCGSIAAFAFSRSLVATFGKGLLAAGVTPTLPAGFATLIGAGLWVGLATRLSLPVSTTHAIVGSIAGVMGAAYGLGGINWHILAGKIALPLLLSPLASLILTVSVLQVWKRFSPSNADCLCIEVASRRPALAGASTEAALVAPLPAVAVVACDTDEVAATGPHRFSLTFDRFHWLTSATASFARGLNDAPKMVALVLGAAALAGWSSKSSILAFLLIACGILAGSLQAGRRVTTVLAERITPMDHREGFIANLITSLLVGPGAVAGLPMSLTHVASGAIIGIGVRKDGSVDWRRVKEMILAWIVTLPAAALLGVISYELLRVGRVM